MCMVVLAPTLAPWAARTIQTPLVRSCTDRPSRSLKRAVSLPLCAVSHRHVKVAVPGTWPEHTDVLCWHCCHPFDGPPIPMPTKYDDKRHVFLVHGTFCSWSCVKKYNTCSTSHLSGVRSMFITKMFLECTKGTTGSLVPRLRLGQTKPIIVPAPPREALKAFGGWMTIDEFRSTGDVYASIPHNMLVTPPNVQKMPSPTNPRSLVAEGHVSYEDVTTKNEMVRSNITNSNLRRNKPLEKQNGLMKMWGLTVEAHS